MFLLFYLLHHISNILREEKKSEMKHVAMPLFETNQTGFYMNNLKDRVVFFEIEETSLSLGKAEEGERKGDISQCDELFFLSKTLS